MYGLFKKIWGDATAFLERPRRIGWIDALIIVGLAGLLFGLRDVAGQWGGPHRPAVDINLSPGALLEYTFFSLCRGLLAYTLSLLFTLVYGFWAAKDRLAERILVPLLDVLQSVPVLGFMPGLVLAFATLCPHANIGLELAAVLMMFTGQVWNMTFSFYQSLRAVPQDLQEVSTVYRFTWWERLKWVELPFAVTGLVWNSMMSMAGGWFFLMISEAFVLGGQDFRLPGLGSYMSVAVERGDLRAMGWAACAMVIMIVMVDQLLWRPVVVWAQKFRIEEVSAADAPSSWLLTRLRRSWLFRWVGIRLRRRVARHRQGPAARAVPTDRAAAGGSSRLSWVSAALFGTLLLVLGIGALQVFHLLHAVQPVQWVRVIGAASLTLGRVLLATALGTLWTVPVGLAIGLSPRLSRLLQPVVQVAASFPAPLLFPVVIAGLAVLQIPLGWGSVALMLLGTQWYILFNVIAGAMALPSDLREAARSYRVGWWERLRRIHVPGIFPYLVTGWVTAAGGAWNASIVTEHVTFKGQVLVASGLGAGISEAAAQGDFPVLAASVAVMSMVVVVFNRTVWRACYRLAESRFSLSK